MTEQTSPAPDVLVDLDRMVDEAAPINGTGPQRGEVAAVALLAGEEIRRLRGWLSYIEGNHRDARQCAREALRGDSLPEGYGT